MSRIERLSVTFNHNDDDIRVTWHGHNKSLIQPQRLVSLTRDISYYASIIIGTEFKSENIKREN